MQNFYKQIIFIFSLLCIFTSSHATHIVGGEIYYRHLGNNNYEITLIVYRDCYNGVPPFDNPATVGIFDVNNNLINTLFLSNPAVDTIPPTINSPCLIPPTDVCYERAIYIATVSMPPRQGGYQLVYQRCCRNFTILNIEVPLDKGITVYATIPSDTSNADNSNPVYNALPPPFICLSVPFTFDNSASDFDGDSIAYELCVPYHGAENANCSNPPVQPCGPQPSPPFSPPYINVVWQAPFSIANLLGGVPMTIDAQTGLLTATPNTIGQFVYAVCAKEYRNGILISTTRRDFQVNVVPCPSLVVAALQTPLINCINTTAVFTNQSIGASTYEWNFGDPTTLADTSNAVNPVYIYPDTGTYTITLIAHSSFNPNCSDTTTSTIHLYPPFDVDFFFAQTICSYTINFFDTTIVSGGGTTSIWNWSFGDNITSSSEDPVHTYISPGNYNVNFIATSNLGCKDTINKTIQVVDLPSGIISLANPVSCTNDCDASALVSVSGGTPPYNYQWNDPNNQITQMANGLCAGNYTVTVTDSNGCAITKNITINEPAPLSCVTLSTDAYCGGKCIGTATLNPSGGTPPYTYSWNDPSIQQTQTAAGLCPGNYSVLLTDSNGCNKTDSVVVNYSDYVPPLDASVNYDTIYVGQTVQFFSTVYSNTIYSWTPANGLSNPNISNPTSTPALPSVIVYEVMITDSNGCENRDSVRIVVKEVTCREPELFIPNAFTPNNDNNNDMLYVRGSTIKELLLRIYDRWGEKVFETLVANVGWDGTYKGKPVQPGVYDYYLEATCFNNEKFFKKGNVTVIK